MKSAGASKAPLKKLKRPKQPKAGASTSKKISTKTGLKAKRGATTKKKISLRTTKNLTSKRGTTKTKDSGSNKTSEEKTSDEWKQWKAEIAAIKAKEENEAKEMERKLAIAAARKKKEEEEKKKDEELKAVQRAKDENGVRHCILKEINEFIHIVHTKDGKVPLILDHERKYSRFNEYQGVVPLLMKGYIVKVYVKKSITKEEAREEMRQKLVSALKFGSLLQIDMADAAPDLIKDFCGADTFPTDIVLTPGAMDEEKNLEKILRPEDYDEFQNFTPRGPFQVVVTSDFSLEEYAEFLADSIPLDKLSPVRILPQSSR